MNKKDRLVACPECHLASDLVEWGKEQQYGQVPLPLICPKCKFELTIESNGLNLLHKYISHQYLVMFRTAIVMARLTDDLQKRHKQANRQP